MEERIQDLEKAWDRKRSLALACIFATAIGAGLLTAHLLHEAVFGLGQIHIRYEFPEQDEIRQLNRSIRREEDKLHLNYFVPELFDDERLLHEAKHWEARVSAGLFNQEEVQKAKQHPERVLKELTDRGVRRTETLS